MKQEFETLQPGDKISLGPYEVTKQNLIEFAEEFDPAPFHLDEEAGKRSILGDLSTSGWHNCAMCMRMMCDAFILGSTSLGSPGIGYCNWKNPVHPGDVLSGQTTLLSKRVSASRPGIAIVELKHQIFKQDGKLILEMENTGFFALDKPVSQ